jgi:hypothetical protein
MARPDHINAVSGIQRLPRFILLGCLLIGLLTGCGKARPGSKVAPPSAPATLDHEAISLLDAFALDNQSIEEIRRRVVDRTIKCMKELGLEYKDPTEATTIGIQGATIGDFVRYAESDGYGVAASVAYQQSHPQAGNEDANFQYAGSTPGQQRAYWLALTGVPRQPDIDSVAIPQQAPKPGQEACMPIAIYQELKDLPFFSADLGPTIRAFAATEFQAPSVLARDRDWSACMRNGGYIFSDYLSAVEDYVNKSQLLTASQVLSKRTDEIRQATWDAGCYFQNIYPAQRLLETNFLLSLSHRHPAYQKRICKVLATS